MKQQKGRKKKLKKKQKYNERKKKQKKKKQKKYKTTQRKNNVQNNKSRKKTMKKRIKFKQLDVTYDRRMQVRNRIWQHLKNKYAFINVNSNDVNDYVINVANNVLKMEDLYSFINREHSHRRNRIKELEKLHQLGE